MRDYAVQDRIIEHSSINETYDVTYISQISLERLFIMKYILLRWKGPISICIFDPPDFKSRDIYKSTLIENDRIQYTWYSISRSDYPYNTLRNMAISKVITSHYYVSDVDFFPEPNLYTHLLEIPETFLSDEWLAVIVPAFEIRSGRINSKTLALGFEAGHAVVPKNKKRLNMCISLGTCRVFRPNQPFHSYYYDSWYTQSSSTFITMVQCFKTNVQEPYVMVKRSSHLPSFDERFSGYGKDKISWIEHLRYIGYKFGILVNGFGVDIPHIKSQYYDTWVQELTYNGRKSLSSEKHYTEFLRELYSQPDRSVVHICDHTGQ
ncbi:hypothetical protein WA158_000732 [Blastocystis sp. Blastoise]